MAGELQTTITFANGDQITSAKLNQIISGASFTDDAVTGTTLLVTGGKLKVGTITASEMGADSVSTTALQADSVIDVVIAGEAVTFPKIAPAAIASTSEINTGDASKLVTAEALEVSSMVPQAYCLFYIGDSTRTVSNSFKVASATRLSATKTRVNLSVTQADAGYCIFATARSSDGSGTSNVVVSNPTTTTFDVTHPTEGAPWTQIQVIIFNA